MKPNLLATKIAQYEPGVFQGNKSGWRPIGDTVLVKPDVAAEKTAGGIYTPENLRERQSAAAESGILIEVGAGAFVWSGDRLRAFEGEKPKASDRVGFTRYSGTEIKGDDGEMYRLMTDNCIGAVKA